VPLACRLPAACLPLACRWPAAYLPLACRLPAACPPLSFGCTYLRLWNDLALVQKRYLPYKTMFIELFIFL
jgi:hypothetical protein